METIAHSRTTAKSDLFTRMELLKHGLSPHDLYRRLSAGIWGRIRPGSYLPGAELQQLHEWERYWLRVLATARLLAPDTVLSHLSAAAIHGLPLWRVPLERVHVIRRSPSGGCISGGLHRHPKLLAPEDVMIIDGVAVTSPALTVVDCVRMLPFEHGVVIADTALERKLTNRQELADTVLRGRRWKGISQARRTIAFADGRSESVGETRSRVMFARSDLPPMELQHEIFGAHGQVVARVDFAIPELKIAGEFDGKVKYGRLLKPGQEPGDVVFEEKLREDAVRDLGWQMVRWIWSDLDSPQTVIGRWQRAMKRAGAS